MNDQLKKFQNTLAAIVKLVDGKDLIRRAGWGEINFSSVEAELTSCIHMVNELLNLPLELLPDNIQSGGTQASGTFYQTLQAIDSFSLRQGGDPNQRCQQLCTQVHSAVNKFREVIGPWIPYLVYQRGDVEENIRKLNAVIQEAQTISAHHVSELETERKEVQRIVESIQTAAAEAGVAVYTQDFQKESESDDITARHWLIGAGVMAFFTMGFLVLFYFWKIQADTLVHMLPQLGCRVLAITLLFTLTFWCGRMYKTMRNQAIQNRHRALGLKTFRAFADAASNAETKDAVLRETTHAIFSATPTGLVNEGTTSDMDPSIVQIAGGMLGSVSGK